MDVSFDGGQLHKAFHDPRTNTVDLFASGCLPQGSAVALGEALVVDLDEVDGFAHLAVDLSEVAAAADLPQRPGECPRALTAEVELDPEAEVRLLFDAAEGTLRVAFGDVEPRAWARLGDNLVWLAIDADAHLAALVIEGVSRDPGGKGQLAWLAEMGAEE